MIHYLRPAGPIRRKRHFHRAHGGLRQAIPPTNKQLEGIDLRQLQRRLRRLERYMHPELSESQHHWFRGLLASGKHGMALESLTRWLAESRVPVPDHIRDEVLWIATSLEIEREVRPILDAEVLAHEEDMGPQAPVGQGFDVPVEEFKQMVADAVDALPEVFGQAMTNVAIVVEEEAEGRRLFGLYQGHPLTVYRIRQWSVHPDKITIYRRTICEYSHTRDEVRAQVYRTVIHEIAHHFGIDDPRLRELDGKGQDHYPRSRGGRMSLWQSLTDAGSPRGHLPYTRFARTRQPRRLWHWVLGGLWCASDRGRWRRCESSLPTVQAAAFCSFRESTTLGLPYLP